MSRIQHVLEEIMGNEALVDMLETEAATAMLDWGIETAKSLVTSTNDGVDIAADIELAPRLKAVRQSMRSVGNWAAGKYAQPESRIQLRDKLLEYFRVIFGDEARLPSVEKMDALLSLVDDAGNTPHQLILKFMQLLDDSF
jgi:hypothetical protein